LTVFDAATLDVVRTIELPRADGVPRVSLNAVPSQSPGRMYVTTGTAARGTLFGVQAAMLFEVDVNRGTLVRAVTLHDWGAAIPFTF
jgi:hypothetical protein